MKLGVKEKLLQMAETAGEWDLTLKEPKLYMEVAKKKLGLIICSCKSSCTHLIFLNFFFLPVSMYFAINQIYFVAMKSRVPKAII